MEIGTGTGTSPQAWGRQTQKVGSGDASWNIPTCVGKTRLQLRSGAVRSGTSPHMWGRPVGEFTDIEVCRNIPTYVGKALKMLSKIKYLTFIKVPNLMAFISVVQNPVLFTCQRTSSPLSGNEPPYNTLSVSCVKQHHENRKRPNTQNQYSERR